jgi:Ras-related C3 botulinum toxin substrate 1
MKQVRLVAVGEPSREKICLLLICATNAYPGEYVPTVWSDYRTNTVVDGETVNVTLVNAPDEDSKKLHPLIYSEADVFFVVFSLVEPDTLENVQNVWVPEIREHYPTKPYILVGTNSDLRDSFTQQADEHRSNGWEPIPTSRGEEVKNAIGAQAYIECSTKKQYNVYEAFGTAIRIVLHPPTPDQKKGNQSKDGRECRVA